MPSSHIIDLTGKRFGRILVLSGVPSVPGKNKKWVCVCDCGTEKTITGQSLRDGKTISCGCFHREMVARNAAINNRTHGRSRTYIYAVWRGMMVRCHKPTATSYPNYGARGIVVCERWHKFENFLADIGERPSSNHSLDRIDNDGNYEPGNCRWATQEEQLNNTRVNVKITYNGETLTAIQWARKLGMAPHTVYNRHSKGWSPERIFTTPITPSGIAAKGYKGE
jgi:hypothetical protein